MRVLGLVLFHGISKCLLTNFGEKRVGGKQAVIHKRLAKPRALYRSLAFLTRFTKVGHEPQNGGIYSLVHIRLAEVNLRQVGISTIRMGEIGFALLKGECRSKEVRYAFFTWTCSLLGPPRHLPLGPFAHDLPSCRGDREPNVPERGLQAMPAVRARAAERASKYATRERTPTTMA